MYSWIRRGGGETDRGSGAVRREELGQTEPFSVRRGTLDLDGSYAPFEYLSVGAGYTREGVMLRTELGPEEALPGIGHLWKGARWHQREANYRHRRDNPIIVTPRTRRRAWSRLPR